LIDKRLILVGPIPFHVCDDQCFAMRDSKHFCLPVRQEPSGEVHEAEALAGLATGAVIRLRKQDNVLICWNIEVSLRNPGRCGSDERNESESKSKPFS
jgi:hypothetical protein